MTIAERVAGVLSQVLQTRIEAGDLVDRAQTTKWDSLNHLRIVLAFEEEFGIRLDVDDVGAIRSSADLVHLAELAS